MKNNLLSKLLPKLLALLFIALIVFPADATLKGTVQSNNNESTQDTPGNNLQNQIDQIVPPAPSRFAMQTNHGNTLQGHVKVDSDTSKLRMAPLPGRSTPPQFGLVDFNTQFRPIRGHVVEQKAMVPIQQSPTYHEFRPVNMIGEESRPIEELYAKLHRESDPASPLQPLQGLFT